jgi:hypothetical protein
MITAAMAATPPPRRQLQSWKEIAHYFGVTERTVQKWERGHGLPVHRLPGERSRVTAWTDELDRWRASAVDKPSWWVSLRFGRARGALAGLILAALLSAAGFLWLRARPGAPVQFFMEQRTLIARDAAGREVWRKVFDEPFAPNITPSELLAHRLAGFADLDGDGQNELLFVYRPVSQPVRGDTLFCFSSRGRVLWQYRTDRTVSTPKETFSPPYLASFFLALPAGPDGMRQVLYVSHHLSYYPSQVARLSSRGQLLGEYWHSGHFVFGEATALDGRPGAGVLLVGISNSHKTTTLVALDPDNLRCASDEREHPDYQLDFPGRDCEVARILMPRTCISRKFDPYSRPLGLIVHPDHVQLGTAEHPVYRECATIFRFDRQLRLLSAEVVDSFLARHRELEAAGQLDHPFTEAEAKALYQVRVLRHWMSATAFSGAESGGSSH